MLTGVVDVPVGVAVGVGVVVGVGVSVGRGVRRKRRVLPAALCSWKTNEMNALLERP